MSRPLPPDTFTDAPSSWAALSAEGEATGTDTGQMPLFDAPVTPASAPARPARLRGCLRALLARAAAVAGATPRAAWPDSFFDVDERP
jgi:hypothetical protein